MKNEVLWYVLTFIVFNIIARLVDYDVMILALVFAIWWKKVWKVLRAS